MAYCQVEDLLLGDVTVGGSINRQLYVDQAAEEMDSKLGWIYKTPIDLDGATANPPTIPETIPPLPRHEALLLKTINAKIATARLIMAVSINEEGNAVHAYALRLLKEGNDELIMLANGTILLSAPRSESTPDEISRVPGVVNEDVESLLDPFYNTVNRSRPWYAEIGRDPNG